LKNSEGAIAQLRPGCGPAYMNPLLIVSYIPENLLLNFLNPTTSGNHSLTRNKLLEKRQVPLSKCSG